MSDVIAMLAKLTAQVSQLQSAISRIARPGTIAQRDKDKGYRVKIGQSADGEDFLSPWIPHPESSKTSIPFEIGQNVMVLSAFADLRQSTLIPSGYSDQAPSPSDDMEANVFNGGGVKATAKDGKLIIEAGGTKFTVSSAGIFHDDHDIGKTHRHRDVMTGTDLSGEAQ